MKEASPNPTTGVVEWSCPSNIAIVKYWGKRPVQIPMNPSLSMTLQHALTNTRVEYVIDKKIPQPDIRFTFEGRKVPTFEDRIKTFIKSLTSHLPLLAHASLAINSSNTFPHSSGIASSASAFGALAMCLVDLHEKTGGDPGNIDPLKKASIIARLGSGSAARSIYPGFSLWGLSEAWSGSSDEFAIPVPGFHKTFQGIRDSILIVESGQKKVSSSTGHQSMENNPYASVRFGQARSNLSALKHILKEGNWPEFIVLMEEEALGLHAMMLTAKPGYLLMQPGTIAILHQVRQFREDTGARIGFTLDAGANVHLLYSSGEEALVKEFITEELLQHCENRQVLHDQMGDGPVQIKS